MTDAPDRYLISQKPYTPLKDSKFWQALEKSAGEFPTGLHYLQQLYFAEDGWFYSQMSELWVAFRTARALDRDDPAAHPLFTSISDIASGSFLRKSGGCDGAVCPIIDEKSRVTYLPATIDVHYLAAAMLMLKHVHAHPALLCGEKPSAAAQQKLVHRALNAGFAIVEMRKMEEAFAKSCAEFTAVLPSLTALSEKYDAHTVPPAIPSKKL